MQNISTGYTNHVFNFGNDHRRRSIYTNYPYLAVGTLRDVLWMDASANGAALDGDLPAEEGGGASGRNCFSAGTTHSVLFAWWVSVDHGNAIRSDTATFDVGLYGEQCRHNDGSVNGVDAYDGLVAVAVENDDPRADGRVALYDTSDDGFVGSAPLGPLPDRVKFTPDGNTVMVANEGEPASDYTEDPEGSVGVVDVSNGPGNASSATAGFGNVDARSLRDDGVLSRLEGLEVTARPPSFGEGDVSDLSGLYLFGGRSYLILDSDGQQVFESGDQFEQIVRNSDDDENGIDEESPAAGPEPEGVAIGGIDGEVFAYIGFEEVGGVAMFDVTDPETPSFVDYGNTRDFDIGPETATEDEGEPGSVAGDLAPEGLTFVPATDSPSGDPLLIVGYEVSGTTAVYSIA